MNKKVLVILAEGFEEIEAITIIDILRRAGVEVAVCGLEEGVIEGSHAIKIVPERKVRASEDADAIVLPGGMPGAKNLAASGEVKQLIKEFNRKGKIIGAICASPAVVLPGTGVLDGRRATCYPGMEDGFSSQTEIASEDLVIDGNVITSRGPATAPAFSFGLIEKLLSKEVAKELRKKMLFS